MKSFDIRAGEDAVITLSYRDLGALDAPTIVTFGDVYDVAYRGLVPLLESFVRERLARLRYMHYLPRKSFEASPRYDAAAALEAAGRQQAFWPFHRLLLNESVYPNRAGLLHRARFLGLDLERFERDLSSEAVAYALEEDARLAGILDIRRLPAIIIDGRRHEGSYQSSELRAILAATV